MSRLGAWLVWFTTLVLVVSATADSLNGTKESLTSKPKSLKKHMSRFTPTRSTTSKTPVPSSSHSTPQTLVSTAWPSTTKSLLHTSTSGPFSHTRKASHSVSLSSTLVPSKHASPSSSSGTSSSKGHASSTHGRGYISASKAFSNAEETISSHLSPFTSPSSRENLSRSLHASPLSMRRPSSLRHVASPHDSFSSLTGHARSETTSTSRDTWRSTSTKPKNTSTRRTSHETDSSKAASMRSRAQTSHIWSPLPHFSLDPATLSVPRSMSFRSQRRWSRSTGAGSPFLISTMATASQGSQSHRASRPGASSEGMGVMRVSKRPLKTPPGTRYAFLNTDSLLLPETTRITSFEGVTLTSTKSTVTSSIPSTMPLTIDPENKQAAKPRNNMLISILFQPSLSWTWLSVQRGTSAQVFTYMPEIVAHALSINESDVKTIQLRRYEQQQGNKTVQRTLYLAYIPARYGIQLQHLIADRTSKFYHPTGDKVSRELAREVDPASDLFLFATQPDDGMDNSMPTVTRNALLGSFVGLGGAATLGVLIWLLQRHLKKKGSGSSWKVRRSDSILSFGNDSPDPYLDAIPSRHRPTTGGSFFAGDAAGSSTDVFQRQQGVTGIIDVHHPDKLHPLCRTHSYDMDSLNESERKRSVPASPLPEHMFFKERRIPSVSVYAMDVDGRASPSKSHGDTIRARTREKDLTSQAQHT